MIQAGYEAGAFADKRLAKLALHAIDHVDAKVADYVATTILPELGAKNYDWLQKTADPKQKAGYFRRIILMHQIAPLAIQPLLRTLAQSSKSTILQTMAVRRLADSPDNLELLIELTASKDVGVNALEAIAKMATPEGDAFILEQMKTDRFWILDSIATHYRPRGLVEAAIELTREMLTKLEGQSEISVQESYRFETLVNIATAFLPGKTLSAESEMLLIHCLNYVPTLHRLEVREDVGMVCIIMRRLAYNGSRDATLTMLEQRDKLPADLHTLIEAGAKRHGIEY